MPRTYPDDERITIRLPAGTRARLDVVALIHDETISQAVRRLVLEAITNEERRWTSEGGA